MRDPEFTQIVEFCEACLDRHGDSYLGVGWTKRQADADTRYRVMLDIVREPVETPLTLLDFGCGASHLYEYICQQGLGHHLTYSGLDVSPRFLELSRRKFPAVAYLELDVLQPRAEWPTYDYIVLNGIFNVKADLSFDAMWSYARSLLRTVFDHARKGIAFNAMSKHVDWERDDLFHLPLDLLAVFLTQELSRHFLVRHDYGLYEYTTYVYRDPVLVPLGADTDAGNGTRGI